MLNQAPMLFGLRVVMLGRQGSGKGTQGTQLARLLVVPHITYRDVRNDEQPGELHTLGAFSRALASQHYRAQAEQHRRRVMLLAVRCLVDHEDHSSYMSRPPLTAQICPVM